MDLTNISLDDLHISEKDLIYKSTESEFAVKIEHINSNIFRIIMSGYLDFESNLYYTGIIEMLLIRFRDVFNYEQVFFISNCSNLDGISLDARKYSEKQLLDWTNFGGNCYIGTNNDIREYVVRLQKKHPSLLLEFSKTEKEALFAVEQFISPKEHSKQKSLDTTFHSDNRRAKFEIPKSGKRLKDKSGWEFNTPDNHFTCKTSILENNIINSSLNGYIRQSDVAQYIRFIENLIETYDIRVNQYSHIIDLKQVKGISQQAKNLLKNAIIKSTIYPSKLFFINPPAAISNTLNIIGTLFPKKLEYCKIENSFESALKQLHMPKEVAEIIRKEKKQAKITVEENLGQKKEIHNSTDNKGEKLAKPVRKSKITDKGEEPSKKQLEQIIRQQEQRIGELSEMIRNVSFNGIKSVKPPKIDANDPFYELFNAVGLMQGYFAESISDKKFNYENIRDQLGLLQRIVNNSNEASLLVHDGKIKYINTAFAKLIGSEKSIIEDRQLVQLMNPDEKEKITSLLEKIQSGDEIPEQIKSSVITELGKIKAVTMRIVQFKYKGQIAALLYFSDDVKTENLPRPKSKANGKLQKLGDYVSESDKLRFSFLANISHEIRTPMTAIVGLAEFLSSPVMSPQAIEEYVNLIKYNANSLLLLLNDLIDISSLEVGEITINNKPCYLSQVLDAVYTRFSKFQFDTGNENIVLKLNNFIDPDIRLICDSDRIVQIMSNLLSNAFKFTKKGIIEFGIFSVSNNRVRIFVRDTGIGIDPDKFEIIFESFKQVDESRTRKYSGVGLGLAISQKIAQLMDGRIWVASKKGEGSTFYLELPLPDPAELPPEEIDLSKADTMNWVGKTFLVVDDVESSYQLLDTILRKSNAEILWAKDGEEAISICNDKEIDLVLMDIQMPNIDGLQATRKIKEIDPEIPVIAQTAYIQEEDRLKIDTAGCDDYISKPIEKRILFQIISKHLNKSVPVTQVE